MTKIHKDEILNLSQFQKKETFILLYDRACNIEKSIAQEALLIQKVELLNTLSTHGANPILIRQILIEHAFTMYRSMFQASNWEDQREGNISSKAYEYDEEDQKLHKRITCHVNVKVAHQDNIHNPEQWCKHCKVKHRKNRGVYYKGAENEKKYYVWNFIEHHAYALSPLIKRMKTAIEDACLNNCGVDLKICYVKT